MKDKCFQCKIKLPKRHKVQLCDWCGHGFSFCDNCVKEDYHLKIPDDESHECVLPVSDPGELISKFRELRDGIDLNKEKMARIQFTLPSPCVKCGGELALVSDNGVAIHDTEKKEVVGYTCCKTCMKLYKPSSTQVFIPLRVTGEEFEKLTKKNIELLDQIGSNTGCKPNL